MPIIDYEKRAEKAEQRVFNNPKIPDATKTILRRFLTAYDVSAARRQIFCDKIPPLLESFDNIEDALTDRDAINHLPAPNEVLPTRVCPKLPIFEATEYFSSEYMLSTPPLAHVKPYATPIDYPSIVAEDADVG